jgi:CDP-glucose 4,6-dehydratase
MIKKFDTYKNLKVLVTGSTGFKGAWLCFWLKLLGAKIIGIGLKPEKGSIIFKKLKLEKKIKQYYFNILDYKKLNNIVKREKPKIIFHLAAQSIVSLSFKDPLKTISYNVMGSANVLEVVRKNKIANLVFITSDKCYLNDNRKNAYYENDILGGEDLYSSSKASTELIFYSYFKSFLKKNNRIKHATTRAGNVVGGGDMKADRIVPDVIKSLINKSPLFIRNPKAIRPWQHVLEPIYGYLVLGHYLIKNKLNKNIKPNWNFGPKTSNSKTVLEVVKTIILKWNINKKIIIKKNKLFKESNLLKLNSDKAKKELKWGPKLSFKETIYLTVEWYKALNSNKNLEKITIKQINYFLKKDLL